MEPLLPDTDAPLLICTAPDEPVSAKPLPRIRLPELPVVDAPLLTVMEPLLPEVDAPLVTCTAPGDPVDAVPEPSTRLPELPVVDAPVYTFS